jgi:hypothetical protein
MIIVRDIFRIKFGQTKDAIAYWKQAREELRKGGYGNLQPRLLTDLAGAPYYTVILETTVDSVSAWEKAHHHMRDVAEWKALYGKIIPLTESGHREILSVVE